MPRGGARPGSGRPRGWTGSTIEPIPRISVPEAARRHTHRAVRILNQVMTRGYLPRVTITKENGATRRRTEYEPASVALRVHCAELLLERGHGKPHQAVAVLDP